MMDASLVRDATRLIGACCRPIRRGAFGRPIGDIGGLTDALLGFHAG